MLKITQIAEIAAGDLINQIVAAGKDVEFIDIVNSLHKLGVQKNNDYPNHYAIGLVHKKLRACPFIHNIKDKSDQYPYQLINVYRIKPEYKRS